MVDWFDVLRNAPIVSAAAWFLLAALQVIRDRWHTWTERFFLSSCAFAGVYALGDWLFFNRVFGFPMYWAFVSLTGLTLAVNFFLLFTLVYVDRMRRSYWGFMAISIGILLMLWFGTVDHINNAGRLPVPIFHLVPFGIYVLYIIAYAILGIWNLYRLYGIVRDSSKSLAGRAAGLMVTFTLVLVLGLSTNGYLGLTGDQNTPPPLSTLLIFVAGSAYYTLYPIGRERISEAIRRFQARRYSIKAAFLTYEDGTLIGAKARPGETVVDQDLFGATLDVIQNFMRTSFPFLRGKALNKIAQGPYTLVIERGRYTYLTIVLEGEETDQLRRQMRDLILRFEARNRQTLAKWHGIPAEAKGTEELLSGFFVEASAF